MNGSIMQERAQLTVIATLGPLAVAFAFALDIYIPTLPKIIQVFHTNQQHVQLTLSLFLAGVAVGQLLMGPLSDQFGRKSVVMYSIVLFVIASIFCAYAKIIDALIVFRVFQALGACGMVVTANAVIRDLYEGDEAGRAYSYLNGCIATSPLFAPVIGGYLDVWLGWQSNFILLALFGLLVLLLSWQVLGETLPPAERKPFGLNIFRRYANILNHRHFIVYTLAVSSGVSCFFTFFSLSPYLLIDLLQVKEQHFAYYFGILGVVFFLGSLLSAQLSVKLGVYRTVLLGTVLLLLGGAFLALWYAVFGLSRMGFVVPMLPLGVGASLMIGAGAAGALEPFKAIAGSAAAVMGCSEFLLAALVGSLAMLRPATSTLPLAAVALVLGGCALTGILCVRRQ